MHFERARDARRAVHYHGLAGEIALGRAAHAEAIMHLSRALDALEDVPDGVQRSGLELGLRLTLGPAWIVSRGYAAAEVERTYSRALVLARKLGEAPEVARALRGLWNVHLVRAELGTARKLAAELLARAKTARDPGVLGRARDPPRAWRSAAPDRRRWARLTARAGGRGTLFPAGDRDCSTTLGALARASRRHEPRPALAGPWRARARTSPARTTVPLVRRGRGHCRPEGGTAAAGRAGGFPTGAGANPSGVASLTASSPHFDFRRTSS
jgi:hypothetical protein